MGCASSWMWLMWMWMLMSILMLMLMMPDYATCRLCERLKGQARRHREAAGLSLRDLGLQLGDVVRVVQYVVWVLFCSVSTPEPEPEPGQINKNRLPLNTQVAREV